ncbi:transmembrane protein 70, mitochondrial [Lithobates pipiens]
MLRLAVCGRWPVGLLRVTCWGEVGGRVRPPLPERGAGSLGAPCQVLHDLRPIHFFSTSPSSSLPEEGKLVYTGNLGRAVLGVKLFSYSTSIASLFLMPYILLKTGIGVDSLVLKVVFCSTVGFFTFVTPVTLHIITKGYVARLYHNSDRDLFTAVTYNALLVEKRTVFSPADVEVPGVSKMFTTFYAKKKSMLVNPDLFPNPWDYHHLMGFDKPFTFSPEDLDKPSKDQ